MEVFHPAGPAPGGKGCQSGGRVGSPPGCSPNHMVLSAAPSTSLILQTTIPSPPPPPEAEQTFVILYPSFVTGFSPGGGLLSSGPAQSSPEQGWAADSENRKQVHL